MNKKTINRVRNQYAVSRALRTGLKPIQSLCSKIEQQIRMKVWANGETVSYDGIRIQFPKDVGVGYCSRIYWHGSDGFEPRTWRVIKHFIERTDRFMDIGSNIGLYSVLAKKHAPHVDTISYEPIPSIFHKNILFHKNNGLSHESVVNAAVGEFDGESEIYLPADVDALEEETTATLRRDSWQFAAKHSTFRVPTKTLDTLTAKMNSADRLFIKIDVEDYESSVFKGAMSALASIRPVIVCEVLPRPHGNQETATILEESGYVAFGLSDSGLIRFTKEDFWSQRTFTDFLFVHASIAPRINYIGYEALDLIAW